MLRPQLNLLFTALFGKAFPGQVIAEHLGKSPTGRVQREIGGASDAEKPTHERRDQLPRPSRPRKIA